MCSQSQSPVFRLPVELRLVVYELVMGNEDVHIVSMHWRMGSFRCEDKRSRDEIGRVFAGTEPLMEFRR
ncbi:hypothetical protein K469DRAFT_271066 [Zopfia rhizophila CBS 207.26]|uniref:DUF7730 domain-containing protein n=1 Tax=Zopfia rhizophila CBS 207.26 TaxID=1314779 RepID=A0A6A6DMV5_9PEZI|nr:hypothetical protein K469DRAFT_271066 [Zopfia rhizophila CBS 207.26]